MVNVKHDLFKVAPMATYPQFPTATIPHDRARFRQCAHCRAASVILLWWEINDQFSHAHLHFLGMFAIGTELMKVGFDEFSGRCTSMGSSQEHKREKTSKICDEQKSTPAVTESCILLLWHTLWLVG